MEDLLTQNNIDTDRAVSIVESFLFTFSEPVDIFELISVFKNNDIKADKKYIKNIIEILKKKYSQADSGLEIIHMEDKYQLVAKRDNFKYLEKVISPKKKKNLTQSAIETLTIIAYNQPTTKAFVEKIKGVKCDTTISKLLEAGLIEECGRLDKIGRPIIYKTTEVFLKHLNISSIKELPDIENMKKEDVEQD
ncbi:segregation and condensation protein B [Peptoanaerobacter stomatis]|uniref:Segregation and condensation protein B n=1 Tax=Peptoanaerobacter stomatis TaxID=796937 RepID=J5UPX2_9FIRM|nr:SMC-Scp complex subunit ScpB [Peptoanaerobacter stomatis]EJU24199.1 segregation and condensation protein B [Peptoanaerobacter stomatis]NWO24977.1 SMC-Scp complex subunit ScpB [Peptostreptococcaceae bacterium oral taxon 081]